MSDDQQTQENPVVRHLHREERRLARLRLVEQASSEQPDSDDHEPDPQEAA